MKTNPYHKAEFMSQIVNKSAKKHNIYFSPSAPVRSVTTPIPFQIKIIHFINSFIRHGGHYAIFLFII